MAGHYANENDIPSFFKEENEAPYETYSTGHYANENDIPKQGSSGGNYANENDRPDLFVQSSQNTNRTGCKKRPNVLESLSFPEPEVNNKDVVPSSQNRDDGER